MMMWCADESQKSVNCRFKELEKNYQETGQPPGTESQWELVPRS